MTARELIDRLEQYGPDDHVRVNVGGDTPTLPTSSWNASWWTAACAACSSGWMSMTDAPKPTDPELLALLDRARNHVMTPEELEAQRQGYARAEASWPLGKFKMVNGVKVYDSYEDYCNG